MSMDICRDDLLKELYQEAATYGHGKRAMLEKFLKKYEDKRSSKTATTDEIQSIIEKGEFQLFCDFLDTNYHETGQIYELILKHMNNNNSLEFVKKLFTKSSRFTSTGKAQVIGYLDLAMAKDCNIDFLCEVARSNQEFSTDVVLFDKMGELCAKHNRLDFLMFLETEYGNIFPWTHSTVEVACRHGNVAIVKYILSKFPSYTLPDSKVTYKLCTLGAYVAATQSNDLKMLKWLFDYCIPFMKVIPDVAAHKLKKLIARQVLLAPLPDVENSCTSFLENFAQRLPYPDEVINQMGSSYSSRHFVSRDDRQ